MNNRTSCDDHDRVEVQEQSQNEKYKKRKDINYDLYIWIIILPTYQMRPKNLFTLLNHTKDSRKGEYDNNNVQDCSGWILMSKNCLKSKLLTRFERCFKIFKTLLNLQIFTNWQTFLHFIQSCRTEFVFNLVTLREETKQKIRRSWKEYTVLMYLDYANTKSIEKYEGLSTNLRSKLSKDCSPQCTHRLDANCFSRNLNKWLSAQKTVEGKGK